VGVHKGSPATARPAVGEASVPLQGRGSLALKRFAAGIEPCEPCGMTSALQWQPYAAAQDHSTVSQPLPRQRGGIFRKR